LQNYHGLHGTLVLAHHEHGKTWRVYFTSGDVISQQVTSDALSEGWPIHLRSKLPSNNG
jgi:hypothetical protein